jgi:glycosyltransferase involved in cell wall biosynthesis
VLVDDGSTDKSPAILERIARENPHVKVIFFQRNFGQSAALAAGFHHSVGDMIVTIDADLQNDPEDIPLLIRKLNEGYDIVSGWRKGRKDNRILRTIPSVIANRTIRWVTGVDLHDIGCTLKVYKRRIARNIDLYGDLHRFIPILGHRVGAKIAEIEVRHHPRQHGVSKYGLGRVVRVLFDLFTLKFLLSFSTRPMHFFGYITLFLYAMAVLSGAIAVYMKWFDESHVDLSGNPLLYLTVLLTIVGAQFLATGLLAEINLRTYHETRAKPIYTLTRKLNFPD